jgi:lysozyme family protein
MPIVPRFDTPQVESNAQPAVAMQAPRGHNFAIDQAAESNKAMRGAGNLASQMSMDMAQSANLLRVDEATNQAKEAYFRLSYDKDAGFTNVRGKDAVERSSGKGLADEYAETYKEQISKISAGLGNDVQRQAFARRANDMASSLYGSAIKHEAEQGRVWADGVDESSVKLKLGEIGFNSANPAKVAQLIEGGKDEQGNPVPGIRQHIQRIADRNGKPAEWVDEKVRGMVSGAHKEIILRTMDKSPTAALAYLNNNLEAVGDHVVELQRTLRVAVDREQGNLKGEAIFSASAPFGSTFDSIADKVLKIEGGYVANDAGKGETNHGINKTANPDVDIKGLTPAKAKALDKERYWNAIGGDALPPEIRAVAFDAAVNHGPSKANKMIAEAAGDPKRLIELRRTEYARLISENPGKYGQYEKSWNNRLNQLSASLSGERSKSAMLEQANQIEDPEQRNIATARINHLAQTEELAKKEAYANNFNQAQEIAFAKPGGWADIPPMAWAQLKKEDQAKLMVQPKRSDPDTLLKLMETPSEWRKGNIEKYRSLLSESDYIKFHADGNGPTGEQKILAATIDNDQFQNEMNRAGLNKMLLAKKDSVEHQQLIDLRAKYEQVISAEQQARGRQLSMDEKNALLTRMIKPVKVAQVRTGSIFGLFDGPSSPIEQRAYQVANPANIIIPEEASRKIDADMRRLGLTPTPERIRNAYLSMQESK